MADSFFRIAGLIGFRPAAFFWVALAFFAPPFRFCFAHRARCAAAILARAAALMVKRFWRLPDLAWLALGGRRRRAG
jgi:hypothetical protein